MKVRHLFVVLVVFCLSWVSLGLFPQPVIAQQCDYYASPDGRGDGLSESSPFQIGDFLSKPESELSGKTLCLLDGTYQQNINISFKSGSATDPITIGALNDNQVILSNPGTSVSISNSNFITIQGITIDGGSRGVQVTGSKHITLKRIYVFETVQVGIWFKDNNDDFLITECRVENMTGSGNDGWGIRLSDNNGPGTGKGVVEKCSIKHGWRAGVRVEKVMVDFLFNIVEGWGGEGERDHGMYYGNPSPVYAEGATTIVEGNIFSDNHGYGLKISKWYVPANIIVRNNIFANNLVGGLITTFGVDGTKAYNNTFYENGGNNLQINAYNYTSGKFNKNIKIKNNLFYSTTGNLVLLMDDATEGLEIDYNCYYSTENTKFRTRVNPSSYTSYSSFSAWQNNNVAPWVDEHSIFQDPAMMDPAQGDYTLQPNSPCIDRGTPVSEVLYDFNFISRSQGNGYDIGAFEYQSGWSEDINEDGIVNTIDLQICVNASLGVMPNPKADVNGDGKVDSSDIQQIVSEIMEW
jgi:hypothetical protein